jgi:hypothetical protein
MMTRPPQCVRLFCGKFSVSCDATKNDATSGELNFEELDIVELIVQIEETSFVSICNEEFTSPGGENGWDAITALCPAKLMQAKT